jgi:two-component system phosphate regulon response regulator PhoB
MNPEVLFWSQNPDFYLVFSHILAVEGLSCVLLDEEEVGELAGRTSVLAIVLDTENNAEHALRVCSLIKADRTTAHIPLLALIPGGDERHYLDLLKAGVTESFVRPISPARILGYLQSLLSGLPLGMGGIRRDGSTFNVWKLSIEVSKRLVRHGSKEIQLGPIEFKLL